MNPKYTSSLILLLSARFSHTLLQTIGPENLAKVVVLNKARGPQDIGICHTHDFCDPNQLLLDAMESVGFEMDNQDDDCLFVWECVWKMMQGLIEVVDEIKDSGFQAEFDAWKAKRL